MTARPGPVRCTSCGHVTKPAVLCKCGHGDVLHDLARDNRTRTTCLHVEGPKVTPCGCVGFTPRTGLEVS